MSFRRRLLFASLVALLIGLFVFWITPSSVAVGLRAWLWWQARRQGLRIEIENIDAPLLRPVVIRRLHITSTAKAPCRIDVKVGQAIVDLQLVRILTGASGRAIHTLSIDALRIETRCHTPGETEKSRLAWPVIQKLLPDSLDIAKFDLRIENESTVVLLRNASISAGQMSAGRFNAGEFTISSPLFRQTFSDLHGATAWHDNRLTLGGLTLTRGLLAQSITMDLSRLGKQILGMEFDVDTFGGKLRASVSTEWQDRQSNWNIAGSAAEVSLDQTSEAFGFTNQIGGLLHACKFTFRGDTRDLPNATASVWMELTDSSWAGRTSELIMLGAALYNRQIQLQQFYVKQRNNELTLSGEGAIPSNSSNWLSPDFRGDISATIHDLGDFAGLFGANPGDFAGEISIDGTMNARDRKIGGHLNLSGAVLTLFKTSIDALTAKLNLKATELEIEELELKRKKDFVRAKGKIDMSHEHDYSGEVSATVNNVAEYLSMLRGPVETDSKPTPANIQAKIASGVWDARGMIGFPGSSPLNFTATVPLRIGAGWDAFIASPLNVTLDFPAIFLASTPQFFHPQIYLDGILSGKLSLAGTLRHPRMAGDVQLLNGKLQNAPMNLTEVNGRLAFNDEDASIDFFNAATKDIDLSFRGEIDFHDSKDLTIKMIGILPIFDLASRAVDCASRIEIVPVETTLAPAIEEMEFRGGVFQSDWTVRLKAQHIEPPGALTETTRSVRLCLGNGADDKTLTLAAHPRPRAEADRARKGKRP